MLIYRRVIHAYPFMHLGGERHCESEVLAPKYNTMSLARAWTRTAGSGDERTNHEAIDPPPNALSKNVVHLYGISCKSLYYPYSFQITFCEKFTTPLNSRAMTTIVIISTPQIILVHGAAARSWLVPEARTVMEHIIVILRITATITVTWRMKTVTAIIIENNASVVTY